MNNLKKVLAVMLALVLVLGTALPVMAATPSEISTYSANLYNLGLYAGVDPNVYAPALEDSLTREQAFVLYAKIMGKASRAADVSQSEIKAYLDDVFVDADQFSDWAKPFATVLIMDKDISGRGDFTMGPKDIIKGNELGVLMLKAMKVPVDYNTSVYACVTLWNMGIITFSESAGLNDAFLTRGDAITIFWKTIANGKITDGDYVAKFLCDAGVMSEASARAVGLLDTYDAAIAEENADAAIEAAEEAVTALQEAPYATEADYIAYKALLADAEAKVAAAPQATRAAFTARINVKKELVSNALAAQVAAAELAVSKYTEIKSVDSVQASLEAIAKKEAAIEKVNAIMDPSSRTSLLASIEATREVLEAAKLLDLTADSKFIKGDGIEELVLRITVKDAFGNIDETANAVTVKLDTDNNGAVSSKEVTLYNGSASVLFTGIKLDEGDDNVKSTVKATIDSDGIEDTASIEIEVSQDPAYENKLKAASLPKNDTNKIELTFENDVDLTKPISFASDSDIKDAHIAKDKKGNMIVIKHPTSSKKMYVQLDPSTALSYNVGDKVKVKIGEDEVEFKVEDTQKPYIVNASPVADNYKKVVIEFNEPVRNVGDLKTKIFLNGDLEVKEYKIDGEKVTVTLDDYLPNGGTAVVTVAAGAVQDFAISDNVNAAQSKSFTYDKIEAPFAAEVEVLSPYMFLVKVNVKCDFDLDDEDITDSIEFERYNYDSDGWTSDGLASYSVEEIDEETLLVLVSKGTENYDDYYKNMKFRFSIKKRVLTDVRTGNDNGKAVVTNEFTLSKDETNPKVESFDIEDKDGGLKVKIKFSEPIDTSSLTLEAYDDKVKAENLMQAVTPDADAWNDTQTELEYVFPAGVGFKANETYYVVVKKGFKDLVGNKGDSSEKSFKTPKAPDTEFKVDSVDVEVAGGKQTITIEFTKDVAITEDNATNALYLGNYRYDAGAGYTYFDEGKATISMKDGDTIVIELDDEDEIDNIGKIIVNNLIKSGKGDEFKDDAARTCAVSGV